MPLASALFEGLVYNSQRVEDYPERYKSPREVELDRRAAEGLPMNLSFADLWPLLDPLYRTYTCAVGRGFYVVACSIKGPADAKFADVRLRPCLRLQPFNLERSLSTRTSYTAARAAAFGPSGVVSAQLRGGVPDLAETSSHWFEPPLPSLGLMYRLKPPWRPRRTAVLPQP